MKPRLFPVGKILKPHGINGEVAATVSDRVDFDRLHCVFLQIDGLFVPFFIEGIRRRGTEALLLTIDGIGDESAAREISQKEIYLLHDDPAAPQPDSDADGFYADDLIGFTVTTDESGDKIGVITGIDDTTANVLFIIDRPDGTETLIPVTDDFITDIDTAARTIAMTLPDGLIS